jgi:inhibitor of KinA sporulation pathway (predicted exonuclease)
LKTTRRRRFREYAEAIERMKRWMYGFEGSHHRGLDDAENIARIVRRVCAS